MGGSLCVFALLLIVRGVIAFCLGEHVSQRLATVLQLVTVAALAEVFFFIPGMLPAMVTRMIFGDPSATALPPVCLPRSIRGSSAPRMPRSRRPPCWRRLHSPRQWCW
jgi:hypothetical protein